ncbi:TPA: DUF3944 domain-containing protein [Haemophilus influenzae]|uniref:DUF3944 domain-containing protein n=1 Tax=Haemophilus influenzae TaxID=727 RepID=UPI000D010C00|nr:DUF3944 domain-containing protein [Haemophilus influenzae]PRI45585.1 hypothetical protein BVZ70_01545 [Haemophilus influenzae]PRJ56778.1 hypothetical protein BV097_00476 [Haemophilus influenzae]PRJ58096.1 hypothetical protein BV094_01349 [Haemophilus influenzae]PRK13991.1 hypothetical protein BV195_01432 [Haemophilus influenzae]PRM39907.1 hypothetical protein BVZ69_01643 [Haemophilus influenzae]
MAYRYDPDLEFLSKCTDEDLNDLVYCLTHDKDGSKRLTEELTLSDAYKKHYPYHSLYWEEIAAEIQCFGGNTFANMFRGGKGVLYKEVLCDVCDKMKVNYNKNSAVGIIENGLISKVLEDSLEKMSPDEIRRLATELGIKNTQNITKQVLLGSFQTIFRAGGFKSYQLTVIVVNAVLKALIGRGLSFAGNAAATRVFAVLSGPIGWVITGLWTAFDIAGAAYRVTIPAVIQVAALRQKILYANTANEISLK